MPIRYQHATALAEQIHSGELSAREVISETLDRIDAIDETLGAFTYVDYDRALETARGISPRDPRPFAGVPIAIKDLTAVRDMPLTFGSELGRGFRPEVEGFTVRKLRAAGFVIVGKTKSPEFGIQPVTEPVAYGPTRNPWDRERTAGGSSGGSAAAVAAGLLPIAHGSDGGGSIRTPAACCGLVGMKPSRGRISPGPLTGESFLGTEGFLTRTVKDTAAALDMVCGYEAGDANWAEGPERPFVEAVRLPPPRLNIGVTIEPIWKAELDPDCRTAVIEAAELLASLDHRVEEFEPPWAGTSVFELFTGLWAPMAASGVGLAAAAVGRKPGDDELEPLTWELARRGGRTSSVTYQDSIVEAQAWARAVVAQMLDYDVILMPSLATRPPLIGELEREDPMETFAAGGRFNPYSPVWNVTGQPAVSLPLYQGEDGLPLGVQLAGPARGDEVLLQLAAQLEALAPWDERRPTL